MKRSQKISKIEDALRDSFNTAPEIVVSSEWQTNLIENIRKLRPLKTFQNRFELNIWRFSWISFAASAAVAVILVFYIYTSNDNEEIEVEFDNNIYTSLAMLD